MLNSAELNRKFPQIVEHLKKPSNLTRGLRKPRKEEPTGPFSLLGLPEKGEFSEATYVIGDLQRSSSIEPPSFAKGITKPSNETLKETKKRERDLSKMKNSFNRVLGETIPSLEKQPPSKTHPSKVPAAPKEVVILSSNFPPKKKHKQGDTSEPHPLVNLCFLSSFGLS